MEPLTSPSRKQGSGWHLVWFCMALDRPRNKAWCPPSHDDCQWVRQDALGRLADLWFARPIRAEQEQLKRLKERKVMASEIQLELPRCSFHPQGLGKRCSNDAVFAIVSPTKNGTFYYFPCCVDCTEEAGELRDGTFFLAHMFGHGDGDDS